MARLQHRIAPGCTFFVTTKSSQSTALFQVHSAADIVVEKLLHYRDAGAYQLHAFVLMPNHLHVLLTPSGTTSLEKAMQLIKGGSSHEIHKQLGGRMEIWQPGFHEATIRDVADYFSKVRYIEQNPVGAGLAADPADWAWGSASQPHRLDPIPQGLKPMKQESLTSELKLRPPNGKSV
jgi:putative transposase